ncbi:hypothetical protein ABFX02_12G178400 [Erythranthe guttata]|nr:PREDICTED: trihelix transcription factor GT-3b [Erythranthe guttata]|eukprot:XP_012850212.1 PREDICTED: trihelix transcription factor GT-3b [Erythranthe guttata]
MDHGQWSQLHHSPSYAAAAGDFVMSSINDTGGGGDRFPQWSIHETRDLLMFRADLDPNFMETKRKKLLWELISTRMKDKGHNRNPLQCKCKWKNLVTRYKGCETTDEAEVVRQQFPFYNEMQTIFSARMQRTMWLEAGGGGGASSSKKKGVVHHQFSSDEDDDLENEDISIQGEKKGRGAKRKRKTVMKGRTASSCGGELGNSIVNGVREMMEDFMKHEMEIEIQWLKCNEEREEKRRVKEMEWRQTMEVLQNERMMIETRWRENEEERKIREEIRSEKRDALITALLNKLSTTQEGSFRFKSVILVKYMLCE